MWRPATRQISGTNEVPLGTRRRFGPAPTEEASHPQLAQPSPSAYPRPQSDSLGKRGRDESPADVKVDPNAPRKRRSRWGDTSTEIPGLPTAISATGVSQAQLDNYAIHLRLEEINRKLRLNDFVPPERERSASPPPTYDGQGRRVNTREVRYRKKLEDERIRLVDRAMKTDPNFRPPVEYHQQKRSQRPSERVYIPVKEFPEINFFGLLVGPRGNSLKKMERDSGAKISIRGRGSVKEGKVRDQFADDAEEDLHCLVLGDSEEKVAACVKMINKVIETAASTPESDNVHKREQLRELAALNGTLRDDENQICNNCGGVGHRQFACPEQKNFTANIVCNSCGSAGHMARDCTQGKGNGMGPAAQQNGRVFDSEYASLMAELGETPGGAAAVGGTQSWSAPADITGGGSSIPPWRRPESWQAPPQQQSNQGYRPPQAGYGGGYGAGGYGGGPGAAWAGYQQGSGYPQQSQEYDYSSYYQGQYAQQA
ncbi:splicing factor SF1 [Mycena belliarum]|uniref:Branchpoint-bridging protein n=1 Tax=Mycena belliarum TaxID=1033014 RepID=A0AAD6U8W0_9AGAR|nr:splicing factor SF1 [Mycena belliae]